MLYMTMNIPCPPKRDLKQAAKDVKKCLVLIKQKLQRGQICRSFPFRKLMALVYDPEEREDKRLSKTDQNSVFLMGPFSSFSISPKYRICCADMFSTGFCFGNWPHRSCKTMMMMVQMMTAKKFHQTLTVRMRMQIASPWRMTNPKPHNLSLRKNSLAPRQKHPPSLPQQR